MEPLLVVAGIPIALYQRIKGHPGFKGIHGWKFELKAGKNYKHATLPSIQVREILDLSVKAIGGAHILAFSGESSNERSERIIELRRHFRFRWLNNDYLTLLPTQVDEFVDHIKREADFEMAWRREIQPKDVTSPLLLPQCAFERKTVVDIWQEASSIAPRQPVALMGQLRGLRGHMEHFRHVHRDCAEWLDRGERIFKAGCHAEPPDEIWYWKFNWRLPDFFHWDVRHARGREFTITGYDETYKVHFYSVKENDYINMDCHGRSRKGRSPLRTV